MKCYKKWVTHDHENESVNHPLPACRGGGTVASASLVHGGTICRRGRGLCLPCRGGQRPPRLLVRRGTRPLRLLIPGGTRPLRYASSSVARRGCPGLHASLVRGGTAGLRLHHHSGRGVHVLIHGDGSLCRIARSSRSRRAPRDEGSRLLSHSALKVILPYCTL